MAYLVPREPDAGTRCRYLKGLKGLSCTWCRHYVTMIAYSFNEATHTAVVCVVGPTVATCQETSLRVKP